MRASASGENRGVVVVVVVVAIAAEVGLEEVEFWHSFNDRFGLYISKHILETMKLKIPSY